MTPRDWGVALLALLVVAGSAPALWAHPIHTTLTDLAYAPRAPVITISVRVFADDFGDAVARRTGVTPARGARAWEAAIFAYARSEFALLSGRERLPLSWCGVRPQGEVLWLCLRAPAPRGGLRGLRVRNAMLLEHFEDQVNIVRASYAGTRRSLLFTRGAGPKVLR